MNKRISFSRSSMPEYIHLNRLLARWTTHQTNSIIRSINNYLPLLSRLDHRNLWSFLNTHILKSSQRSSQKDYFLNPKYQDFPQTTQPPPPSTYQPSTPYNNNKQTTTTNPEYYYYIVIYLISKHFILC